MIAYLMGRSCNLTNEIIRTDGSHTEYPPANGKYYTLRELQHGIGDGLIQIVHTKDGRSMVIDGEGKLKGLPVNPIATYLYPYGGEDPIVGDVVVCNPDTIK